MLNKEKIDVKALREKLNMTVQEFAVEVGVNVNSVYRWERGAIQPSNLAFLRIKKIQALADKKE
jgi:DNA-binding transcriptional regulator YiaG